MDQRQARRKGHDFERRVAQILREAGFEESYREQQSREGSGAPDVRLAGYHIECKHRGRLNIEEAVRQAIRDAGESGRIPVAITRRNHSRLTLVTMTLDDFIRREKLLRELQHSPPSGTVYPPTAEQR